jgi:hypothetical protein
VSRCPGARPPEHQEQSDAAPVEESGRGVVVFARFVTERPYGSTTTRVVRLIPAVVNDAK